MSRVKRIEFLIANDGGGITIQFAFILPVLLLLFGSGLDYALAVAQRQNLQAAVDSAALRAAKELGFADAKRENVASAVEGMVSASMKAEAESQLLRRALKPSCAKSLSRSRSSRATRPSPSSEELRLGTR